jgi:hypothetical protein
MFPQEPFLSTVLILCGPYPHKAPQVHKAFGDHTLNPLKYIQPFRSTPQLSSYTSFFLVLGLWKNGLRQLFI